MRTVWEPPPAPRAGRRRRERVAYDLNLAVLQRELRQVAELRRQIEEAERESWQSLAEGHDALAQAFELAASLTAQYGDAGAERLQQAAQAYAALAARMRTSGG